MENTAKSYGVRDANKMYAKIPKIVLLDNVYTDTSKSHDREIVETNNLQYAAKDSGGASRASETTARPSNGGATASSPATEYTR